MYPIKHVAMAMAILSLALFTACEDKPAPASEGVGQFTEVSVSAHQDNLPEGQVATFEFALASRATRDVRIYFRIDGSAIRGTDYDEFGSSIVIPKGDTRRSIQVQLIDDTVIESTETLYVILEADLGYTRSGEDEASVRIVDNDKAKITINVSTAELDEGHVATSLLLTAHSPAPYDVSVALNVTGSASTGLDFEPFPTTLTIPAFQTTITQTITILEDEIVEADETINITVLPGSAYELSGNFDRSITILNDDVVTASLELGNDSALEGSEETLYIHFDRQVSSEVFLSLYVDGSAERTIDYQALAEMVIMPAMSTELAIPIRLVDDDVVETTENLIFELEVSATYRLGTSFEQVLTIVDNDMPEISVSVPLPHFFESGGANKVTLNLDRSAPYDLIVPVRFLGDAVNGSDYSLLSETVVIPAGQFSYDILLNPIEDGLVEEDESIHVYLLPGSGYVLAQTVANLMLSSGDKPAASLGLADTTVEEGSRTVDFRLYLDKPSLNAVSVTVQLSGTATEGEDFGTLGRTVIMPLGQTETIFSVTLKEDVLVEQDETLQIAITAGDGYSVGATDRQILTITNDDTTTVSFTTPQLSGLEASASQNAIVSMTHAASFDVEVPLSVQSTATAVIDYDAFPVKVTIPAGETQVDLPITIRNDSAVEVAETIRLTLQTGTGYVLGTVKELLFTITDDDVPSVWLASTLTTVSEEGSAVPWEIRFDAVAAYDIDVILTVDGTAANGSDYALISNRITMPAGQTARAMSLNPINDGVVEFTETIKISLATDAAYSINPLKDELEFTMTDGDKPQAEFSVSSMTGYEGQKLMVGITFDRVSPSDVTIDYMIGGTAEKGQDYVDPGPATMPAGQSALWIPVDLLTDSSTEGDETITLTLQSGAVTLGSPSVCTITLKDTNDPVLSFTDLFPIFTEAGGTQSVTIAMAQIASYDVHFEVVASGPGSDDIESFTEEQVIRAGQLSITLNVDVNEDVLVEGDEILYLTLGQTITTPIQLGQRSQITILDNDLCSAQVSSTTIAANEGALLPIKIKLDQTAPYDIRIPVTVTGTATAGEDHNFPTQVVTIPRGQKEYSLSIMATDDADDEPQETVIVTLGSSPDSNYVLGSTVTYTIRINDNDVSRFYLDPVTTNVTEGGTLAFRLKSTAVVGEAVTVFFDFGGTLHRDEFNRDNFLSYDVPAGAVADHLIQIPVTDDDAVEREETLTITISDETDYDRGAMKTIECTVADNDLCVVTLSETTGSQSIDEGDNVPFRITLDQAAPYTVSVQILLSGTSQGGGIDWTGSTTAYVTLAAGQTQADLSIFTIDDDTVELTETIIATVQPGNYVISQIAGASTIGIVSDDLPVISISSKMASTPPGLPTTKSTVPTFTIMSDQPLPYDLTLNLYIKGGYYWDGTGWNHHDYKIYLDDDFTTEYRGFDQTPVGVYSFTIPAGTNQRIIYGIKSVGTVAEWIHMHLRQDPAYILDPDQINNDDEINVNIGPFY